MTKELFIRNFVFPALIASGMAVGCFFVWGMISTTFDPNDKHPKTMATISVIVTVVLCIFAAWFLSLPDHAAAQ